MNRKLNCEETEVLNELIEVNSLAKIISEIIGNEGNLFLVGGAVRDLLLRKPIKDLDFEVYNMTLDKLQYILEQYGSVNLVGKSFAVLKFRGNGSSVEIDWSLPRSDSIGRKPQVHVDINMDIGRAFRRRDLTINALGINLAEFCLYDPCNGEQDLCDGILRYPDEESFQHDPLRFFRVMQFIGRFQFKPTEELNQLCQRMDLTNLSQERIGEEIKKLFLKSEAPSLGFRWLKDIGRLEELFPELAQLINVSQNRRYHPEGDVFEHTMQVLDAAAQISHRLEHTEQKLILLYAALCHDLGKAVTAKNGGASSYGHEIESVPLTASILHRYCNDKNIIAIVKKLVRHHMAPLSLLKNEAKVAAFKRLAARLAPETNGQMLALLFEADKRGRNGAKNTPLTGHIADVVLFVERMRSAGSLAQPERPILTGRDLLKFAKPGPQIGALLKKAYQIQLNEGITDKESLQKRVLEELAD